jgi:HK97 family phage prohead protease
MLKVRGYASVFGNQDSDGEVIDRGAFSNWLKANPDTTLSIYWNHAHIWSPLAKPIGKTTKLRQDRKGLYFEGEILDTTEGLEVQELLKNGAINGASFAYRVADRYQKKNVWHIADFEKVSEITAANWGANSKAYIEAVPDQGDQNDGS